MTDNPPLKKELIKTLREDRDVRITASKHEKIIKNIAYEDLPPLPTAGLSRIFALSQ